MVHRKRISDFQHWERFSHSHDPSWKSTSFRVVERSNTGKTSAPAFSNVTTTDLSPPVATGTNPYQAYHATPSNWSWWDGIFAMIQSFSSSLTVKKWEPPISEKKR